MKKYTHAWLSLKAIEVLERNQAAFCNKRRGRVERFLNFIDKYPDTFVRGAWFPDTIIKDNVRGGHTWKYYLDEPKGKKVPYRPPKHNFCSQIVKNELSKKVSLDKKISDLPDRCEALSQTIRDMVKITNSVNKGDITAFNDTQVALMFLMLAHYVADAHMPMHCDNRDFYDPSHIHPDIEKYWEDEVLKYYHLNFDLEQFDLDENQKLQLNVNQNGYSSSILKKCDDLLNNNTWDKISSQNTSWNALLGSGNNNLWDYIVSVCLVAFHMSLKIIPLNPINGIDYNAVRIVNEPILFDKLELYSPKIIADSINSIALVWLTTWERWERLKEGRR